MFPWMQRPVQRPEQRQKEAAEEKQDRYDRRCHRHIHHHYHHMMMEMPRHRMYMDEYMDWDDDYDEKYLGEYYDDKEALMPIEEDDKEWMLPGRQKQMYEDQYEDRTSPYRYPRHRRYIPHYHHMCPGHPIRRRDC
jgi:hypothetical protein